MLFRSEARALGGYDGQLPRLREVAWTLWLAHLEEHPVNVVEALCHLLGAVRDPDGGGGPTRRRRLRSVTATLNPEDVRRFLANRTVPDSLKDDDRLVLVECPSQDQDMNVASVRHWWERKAGFHSPSSSS
ncbi:hypothetical protein FA10DRAFT_266977 [Acaromyces ingoldii]|uniref:Uncharacterized protein n=1 Tax=Acaromyces ingoldii TaxID=215250 RepID=A0A316YMM6_9BASI|nr:hypothetical protein FA10DRAFT_266977 [Acaromyces ingoldii]PWN90509.1 hypothetical protein FA10DRAFT_266977 [Acaromyces ingoldii]